MTSSLNRRILDTLKCSSRRNYVRTLIHRRYFFSKNGDNVEKVPSPAIQNEQDRAFLSESLNDSLIDPPAVEFPSDLDAQKRLVRQSETPNAAPIVSPENTSVLLFPGQGSQFVGMGAKLLAYPGVEELYNKASQILGYNLLDVCINGPESKLNSTKYCQPAVVVTSLAAMEKLKEEYPQALDHVVGTAGFSVGEFTSLVISEVLSFDDAIHLVNLRAKLMQESSDKIAGGMMTVFCDHKTQLRTAMAAAREYCRMKMDIEEPVCTVANYLCTEVKVVAGHEEALQFLEQYGREWGIRRVKRLPVSGAFHTQLMKNGGTKFWDYVDALEKVDMGPPIYDVHKNIDGKPMPKSEHMKALRYILKVQPNSPVQWEQSMHSIYKRPADTPFPCTYEVGPGRQLGFLLKNVNLKAYRSYKSIEV